MASFDDYHRTVIGYHGTGLAAALRIITRVAPFRPSQRDFDWLGRGVYFWEYAPQQALRFARIRQRQFQKKKDKSPEDIRRATEPLAVVGCMIRLGNCFDLLEPDNVEYLQDVFADYKQNLNLSGLPLPRNTRKYRKLDFQIFEHLYQVFDRGNSGVPIDSARGVYVPAGGDRRVWEGSWVSRDAHIQICVRNSKNMLGIWLHQPTGLEIKNVREALFFPDANDEADGPPSQEEAAGDAPD